MITLIFGDSIAWGAFDNYDGGWAGRLQRYGFERENFVYNCSISGNSSADILTRMRLEIETRWDKDDDLQIIFAFGINDAARLAGRKLVTSLPNFKANVKKILLIAKEYTDNVYFVGPTQVDEKLSTPVAWHKSFYYYNKDILEFNKELKQMMDSYRNIKYIEMINVLFASDLKDGVHPNQDGHFDMYNRILSAVEG